MSHNPLASGSEFVYLSGHGPLGFNNTAIDFMRPCCHGIIDLPYRRVCHKAKPSGSLAVGVPHHLDTKAVKIATL